MRVDMPVQVYRGPRARLPASADEGVLVLSLDTGELFYGTGDGLEPVTVNPDNVTDRGVPEPPPETPSQFVTQGGRAVYTQSGRALQSAAPAFISMVQTADGRPVTTSTGAPLTFQGA